MKTPNFKELAKPSIKDLMKVSDIHERIEQLILSSEIHEDIIEYLLHPFETVLTENGVNLQETT